jgi:hypothetical protein
VSFVPVGLLFLIVTGTGLDPGQGWLPVVSGIVANLACALLGNALGVLASAPLVRRPSVAVGGLCVGVIAALVASGSPCQRPP